VSQGRSLDERSGSCTTDTASESIENRASRRSRLARSPPPPTLNRGRLSGTDRLRRAINYVGETTGWVCKASAAGSHTGAHNLDPLTKVNYRVEIQNTLLSYGLVPIGYGPTGGSASGSSFCRETDG
jgi:hypothetical protein